jgi:hypothetical protein
VEFKMTILVLRFMLAVLISSALACSTRREERRQNTDQYGALPQRLLEVDKAASIRAGSVHADEPAQAPASQSTVALKPTESDINLALHRIYEDLLRIDRGNGVWFVTGYFNEDDSEDVAVRVKVANRESLRRINSEAANWIAQDPRKVILPSPDRGINMLESNTPTAYARLGDGMLAIIHGLGSGGWRNAAANQSYLLIGAAGASLEARRFQDVAARILSRQKLLVRGGEVIEQTQGTDHGFLVWTGAFYAWIPESAR